MITNFSHFLHLGNKVYEDIDKPCPFCSSPIYVELATKFGKVHIVCGNPDCTAQATSNDIESCLSILEQVKDELLIERGNIEYHREFPRGDSRPED